MLLADYQTLTQALLQAPSSPVPLISPSTLTTYINQARLQVAAQGRCIRVYATLPLVVGQRAYPFSAATGIPAGVAGIYHIRQAWMQMLGTSGQVWLPSRPFESFGLFSLNNPAPPTGQTKVWAQFGQGEGGSIFVDPLPDFEYTMSIDVLGVPAALVDGNSIEAIPDIWTLAVPFYAAWWGFQSAQRQSDAEMMLQRFQQQMTLARSAANPDILPQHWSQSSDPEEPNRLGSQGGRR